MTDTNTEPCPRCGVVGKLDIEMRFKITRSSLAGSSIKVPAREAVYLTCGACELCVEGAVSADGEYVDFPKKDIEVFDGVIVEQRATETD
jgi:hypothetical protein